LPGIETVPLDDFRDAQRLDNAGDIKFVIETFASIFEQFDFSVRVIFPSLESLFNARNHLEKELCDESLKCEQVVERYSILQHVRYYVVYIGKVELGLFL